MNELYIRGVVIANGIPDSDGDVLDKKQIKIIFDKYNGETDTMHTYIKNEGVDVKENWITETPTSVNGKSVPAGSWLAICKITNPELIESILNKKLTAYSLGSVPLEATTEKYWFINKSRNYRDYADIEDIKPLFISIVDVGANGYTFEVMTYDVYINKNDKSNGEKMENEQNTDDMVSMTALEKIAKIFGINKNEKTEKAKDNDSSDEKTDDISNRELLDSIKSEVASGVVEGLKEFAKQNGKPEPEKTDKSDEKPPKTNKSDEKADEEQKEDKTDKKTGSNKEKIDKVKTNKRQTQKVEDIEIPDVNTSFYKQSGRDEFGCKIRKQL